MLAGHVMDLRQAGRGRPFRARGALVALLAAALAGCTLPGQMAKSPPSAYQNERFQFDETFSRLFDGNAQETCEAARRALLSQGYVITSSREAAVSGAKRFQPEGEVHLEILFTVVCVPDGPGGVLATAFVSAQQDRYVLKKVPNNTSVGVGGFGSISIPLSSSEDSLVKVGSETIPAGPFYDRYFALMQRLLADMR
jgi:hypothetical protein